jgi:hypothetical protein
VLGPRLDSLNELLNELLRPRGDDDPKLGRRPVSLPPLATALWNNGLEAGEKGVPDETRRSENVGVADKGEPLWLAGLPLREVDTRYRGGVT